MVKETVEQPEEIAEVVEAEPLVGITAKDEEAFRTQYQRMAEYFRTSKRVRIRTMNEEFVQLNGYGFHIAPRKWVEVPEDVAEVLAEAGRI
jgi:hypothetical protein